MVLIVESGTKTTTNASTYLGKFLMGKEIKKYIGQYLNYFRMGKDYLAMTKGGYYNGKKGWM